MVEINAKGLKCPEPVILTKNALEKIDEGEVRVIVDNNIACENIKRLANNLNYKYGITEEGELFNIVISKGLKSGESLKGSGEDITIVICSDKLGSGDDALGDLLMKSYIYSLTEISPMPKTIIFMNSGVKLAIDESAVLESLDKLHKSGIEIISCGTCLDFYGLKEKLSIGIIGNMYSIAEKMNESGKTITIG